MSLLVLVGRAFSDERARGTDQWTASWLRRPRQAPPRPFHALLSPRRVPSFRRRELAVDSSSLLSGSADRWGRAIAAPGRPRVREIASWAVERLRSNPFRCGPLNLARRPGRSPVFFVGTDRAAGSAAPSAVRAAVALATTSAALLDVVGGGGGLVIDDGRADTLAGEGGSRGSRCGCPKYTRSRSRILCRSCRGPFAVAPLPQL